LPPTLAPRQHFTARPPRAFEQILHGAGFESGFTRDPFEFDAYRRVEDAGVVACDDERDTGVDEAMHRVMQRIGDTADGRFDVGTLRRRAARVWPPS
jgi:hypothetical protein